MQTQSAILISLLIFIATNEDDDDDDDADDMMQNLNYLHSGRHNVTTKELCFCPRVCEFFVRFSVFLLPWLLPKIAFSN